MSTAEKRAAIEVEYFESPDALDRVCEEEDDLIDDYLSSRLASDEHSAFESHYLATPHHRMRVEISRRLRTAAATVAPPEHSRQPSAKRVRWFATLSSPAWAASVCALVLVASGAVWIIRSGSAPPDIDISTSSTPGSGQARTARSDVPLPSKSDETSPRADPSTPLVQPIVVALSISPTTVRGSTAPATLIIPNAAVVVLRLQGEGNEAPLNSGRAVVRTVAGDEVWRGPAARGDEIGTLGRIEIMMRLKPEDYIVELFASDPDGREVERHQYFFRVRQ